MARRVEPTLGERAVNPVTHLLASWLVAEAVPGLGDRDRFLIVVAGVIPDVDGMGAFVELATRDSAHPLLWFSEYHHSLHNAGLLLLVGAAVLILAQRRWTTLALAAFTFHLHLAFDVLGGRGPDGSQWPISYLAPFSGALQLMWRGQWALNAWPNILLTVILLAVTLGLAWDRGRSPVGLFSKKADGIFVGALRQRFPRRSEPGSSPAGSSSRR
jgi:inner membrane protein